MKRRNKPRQVRIFDWSPNLAYIVGLITTDGCLSSNYKNVIFTSKDIELIGIAKNVLGLNGKIGFTRNSKSEAYRIQFSSVQLFDWLLSIGLTPKKSLTLKEISIPDNYFIDFLRGHLDGDGSIVTYTDFYNTKEKPEYIYKRLHVKFISASQDHIFWLHDRITKLIGIQGAVHKTKVTEKRQNPIHIIKFGKKESLILLSKIYYSESLPCLSRKKEIYMNFLNEQKR